MGARQRAAAPHKSLVGGEILAIGGAALADPAADRAQPPTAAVAAALAARRQEPALKGILHLASSERRAEEIGRALQGMCPEIQALVLPPWDCLPYDRASPSRDVMGRRMGVLDQLRRRSKGLRILLASPLSLLQRLPPADVVKSAFINLRPGAPLDRAALTDFARRTGYVLDDRVDEPGEIALLGAVIDVFPADAAQPVRIALDAAGVISEIRNYDPLTQRTNGEVARLSLGPASELILGREDLASAEEGTSLHPPGVEHQLASRLGPLTSLLELIPRSWRLSHDPGASAQLRLVEDQIADAFEAQRTFGSTGRDGPTAPGELYVLGARLAAALARRTPEPLALAGVEPVARPAASPNPGRAFCDLVAAEQALGRRVILGGQPHELRALARSLARGLDLTPAAGDWDAALRARPGAVMAAALDLEAGFTDAGAALTVIAAADVLGARLAARRRMAGGDLLSEPDLRPGDVVLHEDHGVGVLRDLTSVEVDGGARDALRLEYRGGESLLAPVAEIGRIWRYGAEADVVTLDRLKGNGWALRRAEVNRHVEEAAGQLLALARAREGRRSTPIAPPAAAYARFAAGFSYPETPDQADAIAAVMADLRSGRPMDRLVCGDVGFGKTEVALRAAAAVALAGRQVAVVAPTTVLARQHFENFRRRFARTGIRVAHLSRLVGSEEAARVRAALATGEIQVVIGTQAIAGDAVVFADLGLMIIDEEQKFGTAMKESLRARAEGGHCLALTATPIPRTLQKAMVGVQDVSVIASPPARRRPVRTFLAPFDPATLRTALLRERSRGGQSFLVTPRIEDIGPMAARLKELVPELQVRIAHGGLNADDVDAVMVGFADGEGDVLLATNIIESGLDVPRANTMFIWRPDRFGLSQLHQLRGRVGRGRVQGIAYLITDPDEDLPDATRARLSTLEAFDRLGSGLAISARDLDVRGGGDLVGEEQAGHVHMIGAALYQSLLERAVKVARGDAVEDVAAPILNLGQAGAIPADYVPDPVTRINLYAKLSRLSSAAEIDAFEEEIDDRFGAPPPATLILLALARLQRLAAQAGVRQVDAGPKGTALSLAPGGVAAARQRLADQPEVRFKDDRVIIALPGQDSPAQIATLERLLGRLAG